MATQALGVPDRTLSIGRVFERTFATVRHNPVVTLALCFVFGALPTHAIERLLLQFEEAAARDSSLSTGLLQMFVMFGVFALTGALSQAVLTPPVVAEAEGRRAGFGQSLVAAGASIVPLVLLTLLSIAAISIGFLLLIIPGVILWVIWVVSVQALVVERRGILESLRRSVDLTDGARWTIFGLLLVLSAVSMGTVYGIEAITGGLESETTLDSLSDPLYLSLSLVNDTLTTLLYSGVLASLYVELRDWKDGPGAESLEDILS